MAGLGTIINGVAIATGVLAGWLVGRRLPERYSEAILQAMGLVTVVVGLQMALTMTSAMQAVVVILALVVGVVIGEWLDLEGGLKRVGMALEGWTQRYIGPSPITKAFVTASIIFVVGPMAILGSIQDGIGRDPSLLLIKSALDGLASIAFTASLGIGTLFSIGPVVLYQGSITLLSLWLGAMLPAAVIEALTATGGLLVMTVGLNLLEITALRLGNFLPALAIAAALGSLPLWTLDFAQ